MYQKWWERKRGLVTRYSVAAGRGGAQSVIRICSPVVMGLGKLTCFVGYCVGFGHRLLVTQVDR